MQASLLFAGFVTLALVSVTSSSLSGEFGVLKPFKNNLKPFSRGITLKCVTSLHCPSPRQAPR